MIRLEGGSIERERKRNENEIKRELKTNDVNRSYHCVLVPMGFLPHEGGRTHLSSFHVLSLLPLLFASFSLQVQKRERIRERAEKKKRKKKDFPRNDIRVVRISDRKDSYHFSRIILRFSTSKKVRVAFFLFFSFFFFFLLFFFFFLQ